MLLFVGPGLAPAEDNYFVKDASIPKDELRQQALLGLREFRCSYILPSGPEFAQAIVECYSHGRLRNRYRGALAPNFGAKTGIVSVGWISRDRELVTIIDNEQQYSPFSRRHLIDKADFDEPSDQSLFRKHEKKEGMIPLFGVCGERKNKMGEPDFETPQDFVKACNEAGAQFCWVVYLHVDPSNSGGQPTFSDGK